MSSRLYTLAASIIAATFSVSAAAPSYVGTWKFNEAKSRLSGDTVTLSQDATGAMTFDGQGFKYSFKPDGQDYPLPDGGTASWSAAAPDVWNVTIKAGGKLVISYRVVVKGETMTIAGKLTKPDGTAGDLTANYKRTSSGSGLIGTWVSTSMKPPFSRLEVTVLEPDGVTVTDDTGAVFSGQFDGTMTPARGRLEGSKYATAFRKKGANSFEARTSVDGQAMYVEVYSVAADGKTLTIDGTPVKAAAEKYRVVFDRQ